MPQITYIDQVKCDVKKSFFGDMLAVSVKDIESRQQFMIVPRNMVINEDDGSTYLPIGFVEIDMKFRRVLIELPIEADSGANRMWVGFDSIKKETGVPA